ncbi:MAG: hypothetical protein ACH255_21055, partial [Candidatus Thiodiazotropha sp.]
KIIQAIQHQLNQYVHCLACVPIHPSIYPSSHYQAILLINLSTNPFILLISSQPAISLTSIHPSMLFSHRLFIHAMHFVPFSVLDWLDVDFEIISTIDRLNDVTELRHSVNTTSLKSIEIHFIFLFISKSRS